MVHPQKRSLLTLAVGLFSHSAANAFAPVLLTPSAAKGPILFRQQEVSLNTLEQTTTSNALLDQKIDGPKFSSSTALHALVDSTEGSMATSLIKLLLETIIVNGVPAVFTILVIAFAAFQLRPKKDEEDADSDYLNNKKNPASELYDDLYRGDESDKPMSLFQFLKRFKPQSPATTNRGIPPLKYITISNLNQKYDSYQYSLTEATRSKAKAAAEYRAKNFDRALRLGLSGGVSSLELTPFQKTTLLELEEYFLKEGSKHLNEIQSIQADLTRDAIDEEMEDMGVTLFEIDPPVPNATAANETGTEAKETVEKKGKKGKKTKKIKATAETNFSKLNKAQKGLMKLELDFVKNVVMTLGSERATGIRTALLGDISSRGVGGLLTQLKDRPLSTILQGLSSHHVNDDIPAEAINGARRKSLYVTRFPGDAIASQVSELREEATAIIRNAQPGDEALVVLQTGGGTVTGYGLAAAQLLRFKEAGMKLTIAVEQVAASGGYMMCCVADKIVSSPFAVLGSIGVITDIPNVYNRLKEEGIEFQTVTAGKYKRTITPTKKVTKEDFDKTKEDVEQILLLFKEFVHKNRPKLDIEAVATGETWFGEDALKVGLTDEIKTADEVFIDYVDNGWDVYEVGYTPPDAAAFALQNLPAGSTSTGGGAFRNALRWLIRTVAAEVRSGLGSSIEQTRDVPVEKRYMMQDDRTDRYLVETE